MKHFFYFLFFISVPAAAQFGLPQGFDQKTFSQYNETALWLLEYDSIAQRGNDSVKKETASFPASELFCWKDKKNTWNIVSGSFDSLQHYQLHYRYTIDSKGKFSKAREKDKADTSLIYAGARANHLALQQLKKLSPALSWSMNTHLRRSEDNSIQVWCLPDLQHDGKAASGAEFTYYINPAGTLINATKQYYKTLQTETPDSAKELTLNFDTERMPTAGAIYFAHRYKTSFKSISIRYRKGTSTMLYNAAEKTYSWMHSAN